MASKDPIKINAHLEELYNKNGYIDKYGGSVIITSLILITFGGLFGYNYFWLI